MDATRLGTSSLKVSRLAYGCMRIADDCDKGKRAIHAAVEAGYTLFDHADIYSGGAGETLFGEVLRESPALRDQIVIQSKCGIRPADDAGPKRYDTTRGHIVNSVEGSLERLGIGHLDVLMLHRPDHLMDANEVAEAFGVLKASGKVAWFGVSNFSVSQFDLLQSAVNDALLVNQVEINLHNIDALHDGVLDQCQRLNVTPQAWCPLAVVAYPAWGNTLSEDDESRVRVELDRQAGHYGVDDWVVVLAWLLKHPSGICPIVGSTTPERIAAATAALDVEYSREDWYRLFEARIGAAVP